MALWLAPPLAAQAQFRLEARHDHWRKHCTGTLAFTAGGVSYEEAPSKKKDRDRHAWRWAYTDIQQLDIGAGRVSVLTYRDVTWKLGADRKLKFMVADAAGLGQVYEFLKTRLDQRLVSRLAGDGFQPLWQLPVKRLGRIRGSEGALLVGADRIVYRTSRQGDSRTWGYEDIENISSASRFQLTITTFERDKFHYGNYKGFNFQLKEALDEARYDELWRRLNQSKGLKLIGSYRDKEESK